MKKIIYIVFVMLWFNRISFAQKKLPDRKKLPDSTDEKAISLKKRTKYRAIIVGQDTMASSYLPAFYVIDNRVFKNNYQKRKYDKLVRDVKIAYPYAKLAAFKLRGYNSQLANKTEEEKKKLMKKVEKDLINEFGDELKNLTITQGRILLKLIDRETGNTTYALLEELRGTVSAFFWQSLARIFSSDLKANYNADGDDRKIEDIIILIDKGQI